jgi:hypothetical protein
MLTPGLGLIYCKQQDDTIVATKRKIQYLIEKKIIKLEDDVYTTDSDRQYVLGIIDTIPEDYRFWM